MHNSNRLRSPITTALSTASMILSAIEKSNDNLGFNTRLVPHAAILDAGSIVVTVYAAIFSRLEFDGFGGATHYR